MWYFNSNLNSNDDKTSLIKTDDFHCWKAKFIVIVLFKINLQIINFVGFSLIVQIL